MRVQIRAFAALAAALVAWGLVAAPLVHQLTAHQHAEEPVLYKPRALSLKKHARRAEAPAHSHRAPGTPRDTQHGAGSLEHGQALLHAAPALPELQRIALALVLPSEVSPRAPSLDAWPRVEMPQGP